MTQLASKKPCPADRAAPAAFLHRPRHHRERRLCLAEGRQMAGGAARSLDPGPGYPQLSRSRERLYREPARPHRSAAEEAGGGDARADQGGRFQRARRRTARSPICANSARAASTRCSAAPRAMAARSSIVLDGDALAAGAQIFQVRRQRGIRRTTGCRPGAPTPRARNIFRSACATGQPAPTSTTSSRRPMAAWSGAWTQTASSTSSSTTTIGRCRCGGIDWARSRPTMCWSMRSRIPAGSPICMRAPAAASA